MAQDCVFRSNSAYYAKIIQQICAICDERNVINNARSKVRYRMHYYNVAANNTRFYQTALASAPLDASFVKKKWIKMGYLKLEARALKEKKKYDKLKAKTHKFTMRTHKKLLKLLSIANARLWTDNGYVMAVRIVDCANTQNVCVGHTTRWLEKRDIKNIADQYKLDVALENMIK